MVPTNVDKVEVSWDDVFDGKFPSTKNPARHAFRQAVTEVAAKATATLPAAVNGRIAKAVAIVLSGDLEISQDGRAVVGSQSDSDLKHVVESAGGCTCKDSDRPEIEGWCKHKIAVAIMKRATALANDKIAAHVDSQQNASDDAPRAEPHHHGVDTTVIPAQFLTTIHGKQFMQYAGLLALAHKQGLVSLSARFIEVTGELALAEATAEFKDGRVFKECSDATPTNVHPKVKLHFPRMALTRAKARALRDALNISMCSVEELEA